MSLSKLKIKIIPSYHLIPSPCSDVPLLSKTSFHSWFAQIRIKIRVTHCICCCLFSVPLNFLTSVLLRLFPPLCRLFLEDYLSCRIFHILDLADCNLVVSFYMFLYLLCFCKLLFSRVLIMFRCSFLGFVFLVRMLPRCWLNHIRKHIRSGHSSLGKVLRLMSGFKCWQPDPFKAPHEPLLMV